MAPRKTTTAGKRKAADDAAPPPPAKKAKGASHGPMISQAPTQRLDVFVFGEGSSGELGLGNTKKPATTDVKRPRKNPFLDPHKVGAVQVIAGGMHTIVLTHDNKILTWGVNDLGALGRDTQWEGKLKDMDAASVSSDDDDEEGTNDLNPREALPGEVDWSKTDLAPGTKFTQVAAGDSCSFVLTDDGKVYGWGTFRGNDGVIGFSPEIHIASRPVLVKGLKDIKTITAGYNHCYALDTKGKTFSWGAGEQDQLGRRVIERTARSEGLKPRPFGLPSGAKNGVIAIESGAYHGFALTKNGDVYSWGLNNYGQTGHPDFAGCDEATIRPAKVVKALQGKRIASIRGGMFHTVASTDTGECYSWGRMDGDQVGIPPEEVAKIPKKKVLNDFRDKPRILLQPTKLSGIKGPVSFVTAASDHSIVVTAEGKAWSWGFSANYQTGQGTTDDITVPTLIDNTAIRDVKLTGATTGGQFGMLLSHADVDMVNGI